MKNTACSAFALAFLLSAPAMAQTEIDIAKAYVQAITDGSGSKSAGGVDYVALGCTSATVFDPNKCQKVVLNGKDGKTLLMNAITTVPTNDEWEQSNIRDLIPEADLKRIFSSLTDPTFNGPRGMLGYLSMRGDGWYANLEGDGKAKVILQRYLESIGSGGTYSDFVWPFDKATNAEAKITEAGVRFKVNKIPDQADLRPDQLYYWALQTDISDMAYPPGFANLPQLNGQPTDFCKDSTSAWGHVGAQYAGTAWLSPPKVTGARFANWGGGGDGDGTDDYGCGGGDSSDTAWVENQWYLYKVVRADKVDTKLWKWDGSIINEATGASIYSYTIFGGEYITRAITWTELIGTKCADRAVETEWSQPYLANSEGKFRVGRVDKTFSNDACLRSKQDILDKCNARWKQSQGAAFPVTHASAADLRSSHKEVLTEGNCGRTADATEIAIAKAYAQAISGGSGPKSVSGAVDFARNGCTADTVWDQDKCQAAVFNGKDGKTVLMNAITPVAAGLAYPASNVTALIPIADMVRIKGDARYAKAKQILIYMSTPNNGWYPWLEGPGQAKEMLRQYMASIP